MCVCVCVCFSEPVHVTTHPTLNHVRHSWSPGTLTKSTTTTSSSSSLTPPPVLRPHLPSMGSVNNEQIPTTSTLDRPLTWPSTYRKRRLSNDTTDSYASDTECVSPKHRVVYFNEYHTHRDAEDYLRRSRRRSGLPYIFDVDYAFRSSSQPSLTP
jgi:hypothetical protein